MIVLAYPVTTARQTKFAKDADLSNFMETFNLTKFGGGVDNGFHTLTFIENKAEAEEFFQRDPELRNAELEQIAGFPVQFYQVETPQRETL